MADDTAWAALSSRPMARRLLVVAVAFVVVRTLTIHAYRDTLYYYGLVVHQFAIAEAAYNGHWFAQDQVRSGAALRARRTGSGGTSRSRSGPRFLPRDRYTTFPAADLPGLGLPHRRHEPLGRRPAHDALRAGRSRWPSSSPPCSPSCSAPPPRSGRGPASWRASSTSSASPSSGRSPASPCATSILLGFYSAFVAALFVFARTRGRCRGSRRPR